MSVDKIMKLPVPSSKRIVVRLVSLVVVLLWTFFFFFIALFVIAVLAIRPQGMLLLLPLFAIAFTLIASGIAYIALAITTCCPHCGFKFLKNPKGFGPAHFVYHPNCPRGYGINPWGHHIWRCATTGQIRCIQCAEEILIPGGIIKDKRINKPMRIINLTDEECYAHLNQPFNPPVMSVGYGEEVFSNEWHQANDRLKRILERHGESDDYGQKDYVIGDTLMLSRGIGVEVTSDRLLNKLLLLDTHEFLCSLDQEYEIDFAIDSTEGIFHVFVSRDSVKTNCPTALIDRL